MGSIKKTRCGWRKGDREDESKEGGKKNLGKNSSVWGEGCWNHMCVPCNRM